MNLRKRIEKLRRALGPRPMQMMAYALDGKIYLNGEIISPEEAAELQKRDGYLVIHVVCDGSPELDESEDPPSSGDAEGS